MSLTKFTTVILQRESKPVVFRCERTDDRDSWQLIFWSLPTAAPPKSSIICLQSRCYIINDVYCYVIIKLVLGCFAVEVKEEYKIIVERMLFHKSSEDCSAIQGKLV